MLLQLTFTQLQSMSQLVKPNSYRTCSKQKHITELIQRSELLSCCSEVPACFVIQGQPERNQFQLQLAHRESLHPSSVQMEDCSRRVWQSHVVANGARWAVTLLAIVCLKAVQLDHKHIYIVYQCHWKSKEKLTAAAITYFRFWPVSCILHTTVFFKKNVWCWTLCLSKALTTCVFKQSDSEQQNNSGSLDTSRPSADCWCWRPPSKNHCLHVFALMKNITTLEN